jgi:hypothetical protein
MGIRPDTVRHLVNRTLRTAENRAVEGMRELENARLDRAQAAIWSRVLAGDYRAVMVFLQISARRARLNSLDSPAALDKLNATAQRHLDDEEQNIVPLAAVTLTQQEWDAMGKHGLAQMPFNKRRLAFAMIPRAARRGRPCLHEAVPAGPGADALPALDRLALEEVRVHAARRNLTLHTTEVEVRSDPALQSRCRGGRCWRPQISYSAAA